MVPKPFKCGDCGCVDAYRSRPHNFLEQYLLPVLGLRPVRCADCFRRSYQPWFVIVRERPAAEVKHRFTA
jgi:hypothetical protein